MSDDSYNGVLLEEMREQNKQILEAVTTLKDVPEKLDSMGIRLESVEADIRVIKAVVTDQSKTIKAHQQRFAQQNQAS